jgi:hypothetical protein
LDCLQSDLRPKLTPGLLCANKNVRKASSPLSTLATPLYCCAQNLCPDFEYTLPFVPVYNLQLCKESRIPWSEQRRTKFEVDRIYSLLGIFEITMPIIHGEEKEEASKRPQEKVEKSVKGRWL